MSIKLMLFPFSLEDQDSLNSAVGGNFLDKIPRECLAIIESKSKVRYSRDKPVVAKVSTNASTSGVSPDVAELKDMVKALLLDKKGQNQSPAPVKAFEESCVTCGGTHSYHNCPATNGNVYRDNIQEFVSQASAVNYNQGNPGYRSPGSGSLPSNTVANPKGELKSITTRSGRVIDGPTIPTPSQSINPEVDKRVEELSIPSRIARDIFVPVGKFTFPANLVIVDYESDPRVPFILGRPFLRTARALTDKESINLINVFNNSSEDFLEDLFSNQPNGNPTFLPHPELTFPEVNNDIFDSEGCNVLSEKLLDLDSTKDLHPPLHDNPLSGSTTYFSKPLLEEFADELPPTYDDNLQFDIESDLKEIEFLVYQDKDSSLKDLIDQKNFANLADIFVNFTPEMFTDEHAFDYSSPLIFDEYDDDFLEVESDAENVYDDPFDSKGEKIKESKLLIDEFYLHCDFLPPSEYDSFVSHDFYMVDALPSTDNEDKIFNPGILIQEKPVEIITRVVQDKKLVISNASLVLEDFDPPFYEPFFFKEVPKSKMLLPFSSENEEKIFKPGIHTSEKVHSSFIPELSHQGYKVFKINHIFKSLMKIFLFYCGKDTHISAVPCHHFYPLDQLKYGGNWVKLSDLKQALRGRHPMLIRSLVFFSNVYLCLLLLWKPVFFYCMVLFVQYSRKFEDSCQRILSSSLHFFSFNRESCIQN
nr:hypothetical protein [Tanacetum cinerariifolium]